MRAIEAVGSLLTLIGGASVAAWTWLYTSTETGDPKLDRFGLRGRVAMEVLAQFRTGARVEIARAMLAIFHRESDGREPPVVGDATLGGGPSVGPGQVYRTTAKDLGLWTPPYDVAGDIDAERAAYAALAMDEAWCVHAAVAVLKNKLAIAGGDLPTAIRLYNGAGPAAEAYRDGVISWADAHGWSLV